MRSAAVERSTKETQIKIELNLDGGEINVRTGIGFFDHMLTAFAVHGRFGLNIEVNGDLEVDCHHTVEDTGIVLGQAFAKALSGKGGIQRYGSFFVPMDEALAFTALDISGRPYLVFCAEFPQECVGEFDTCMTEEFFRAFAFHAGITMHIKVEYGTNSHHMIEGIFKSTAHAMKAAVAQDTPGTVLSTKGALD